MDARSRAAAPSTPAVAASPTGLSLTVDTSSGSTGSNVTPMVSNLQATVQAQLAQAKAKREEEERTRAANGGVLPSSDSKREFDEKEQKSLYDYNASTTGSGLPMGSGDEADRIAAAKKEDERKRHTVFLIL
jgi:hypothetical protein